MDKKKEKESIIIFNFELFTEANGSMMQKMEMVMRHRQMDPGLRDSIKMALDMEKELTMINK